MNDLEVINEKLFEDIKHADENGNEYWYARKLQKVLNYTQWRRFKNVIDKAIISSNNSNNNFLDHFADIGKMITVAKGAKRKVEDYKLSR